ncbi:MULTISPECIES: Ldh family oxidoreductase [unclassified Polaromonas]|uniref:Ldh family oxidoreductase n=1 Tax=unclassified Polaromonas TaxID=2638319 RepID=UPI0018CBC378|nr:MULTISPECIES: Ldh family oxidoreductase [unclassified Polaromonas]MBG6070346.1 (2R)-3-sulfolactate dehydrogenase (NADP+) [Polaromonas sp. CG_9.7]MBG6112344.1 (2R)-3-sulfolactate dehydrogenase (NADP+) [Polaromonas sp. CG_9.2]MDH6183990.1 (2R)-3-sulfolactate dehydrogenase (NADP+) [Polaromonas sp. CG_23.6]
MLHSYEELNTLVQDALTHAGASPAQASATALALVAAEASGLPSHGLSRVTMYVAHLKAGRVLGDAVPAIRNQRASAVLVDACNGFAFPACRLAIDEAIARAAQTGIAIAAVTNSHHFGMASYHLDAVASAGMVGIACGNSPAAMPAAGGKRPIFGTNPIAAIFPREGRHPVSIDLSLSEVARGKLMVAAKKGEAIPLGWALDADGNPTTDPKKGLEGSMLPMGGVKGAMLALMVELLVTTLTGAHFGAEADTFFVDEGNQPRLGQAFIVIDPGALGGTAVYGERIEALLAAMLVDEGVRLPGQRRFDLMARADASGIDVSQATLDAIKALR